jgi:hypothetical protein
MNMDFVNEYAPEADVDKYGLKKIDTNAPSITIKRRDWTSDRDRGIYLRQTSKGRAEQRQLEALRMKCLITVCALLMTVAGCTTPSQMAVDAEVKRLCAIDGGVKVYEAVKLPATEFDQWGMPKTYQQRIENKAAYQHDGTRTVMEFFLGSEYALKRETRYYRQGDPDMFRLHTGVFRRLDGKLLGESVFYKRGGGDPPGPWHGSTFMCPEPTAANDVLRRVFEKE